MCSFVELRPRRLLVAIGLSCLLYTAAPAAVRPLGPDPAEAVQDVLWYQQCANGGTSMVIPYAQSGFTQGISCPTASTGGNQRGVWTVGSLPVPGGDVAHWEVDAPPNIRIAMAHVPEMQGDNGSSYWGGSIFCARPSRASGSPSPGTAQSYSADTFPRHPGIPALANAMRR